MKRAFRPFWSYHIRSTEEWLEELSKNGWQIEKFNRFTRIFYFRSNEQKKCTYQIGYEKVKDYPLPNALRADGWQKLYQNHNWYVLTNDKPNEEIKTKPIRENIIQKNRIHYYMYCVFLYYCVYMILANADNLSLMLFLPKVITVKIMESPFWAITYIGAVFTLLAFVVSIYSVFKIRRNNHLLIKAHFNSLAFDKDEDLQEYFPFDFEEEQMLIKSGKLKKVRKFTWMNDPDKLERWLEKMEAKGFNLFYISRTGTTFYFLKGEIRLVSYGTEYQNIPDETAFFLHKENGWEHIFSSRSSWQKWTIWAKVYDEGIEKPKIYSEKEGHLKAARTITITNIIMFLPIMTLFAWFMIREIIWKLNKPGNFELLHYFPFIMFTLLFIIFAIFTFQSLAYFYRLKNKYEI